jgi:hypothetical protein
MNETPCDAVALDDLRTPEQLAAERPDLLTVPALRWQLRNRKANGLSSACVMLCGRTMISKSRYERWLATQLEVRHV